MSSKGKKYKKMVKQVELHEVWEYTNPSVNDGSWKCDGDCSRCGYKHVAEIRKIFK